MKDRTLYRAELSYLLDYVEACGKVFLVTGASGLIGSCLVDLLMMANERGQDNQVYALGRSAAKLQERFSDYLSSDNFHIIEQDICSPLDDRIRFDYIVHCASNADPAKYVKYPAETVKTIVLGGINVLEYARSHEGCTVEVLSSFEVYGDVTKDSVVETDAGLIDFNMTRSCYPEGKRAMESLARCYWKEYGVQVCIGRLCSVYGPTMAPDDSKAHAQFLRSALKGEAIVLKSKGEQKRTYCYVPDAASGILRVLFRGKPGEAYNISNEQSVSTIAGVADAVSAVSGCPVVHDDMSETEKDRYSQQVNAVLDNKKLRELGWEGRYDLTSGISSCLAILGLGDTGKGGSRP